MKILFRAFAWALLVFLPKFISAQISNDTASYPYWIEMMKSPNPNYYSVKRAFELYWKDSVPNRGYGYKVFKRWEWRVRDKMNANGDVIWNNGALSEMGYTGQGNTSNQNYTGFAAPCPANGRWTAVGPYKHPYNQSGQPTGVGRLNGIAFHPTDTNTVFALAPQGGVWKTTNNGSTWEHIFGNSPVVNTIGVSSMLISYNNPDTMYIGTGDRDAGDAPGMGVLWTTNGGQTWAARNTGISNLSIAKMVMHPKNSAILIIATNGGVYRSINSGASWSLIITGNYHDIVMHPMNPNIVYATRSGLFFRSSNNGQSFTQITTGLPATSNRGQIAVTKANRDYVYFVTTPSVNFQGLYRSADSGLTFTTMSTTPNILGYYDGTSGTGDLSNGQGWYDLDIAADPRNANTIYVGGINIWKSTNGGATWTQVAHWYGGFGADDIHADQHALEFNTTGYKLYSGNDGGIYFTGNAGFRWTNITTGIQNSQIYRIAHAQTDEFIGAQGYQDNGSSQTTNDEFYTYYGGDGMDCQVDPGDARYVYGSYVYGSIYRAIDKNAIATVGANGTGGINESGAWLTPFVLQEGQPGTMFAGYSNVWRTTAVKTGNPPAWTAISTGFGGIRMLENSPARNSMLYVLRNSGNIRRTGNANAAAVSWTDLGTGPGGVRWIESHHKDSNRVYCVNSSTLYRSTNKGATWTAIAVPSGSGALNNCTIDTSSKTELIYIGTERGVYVWDSLGNRVVNYNNSFPVWADVTDLAIWYSPKGREQSKIVASTYGRGVWRTNLFDPGTSAPKSRFYSFDSVLVVGGKERFYEKISGSVSSLTWKITPFNYSYTDGTDSTSYAPVIQFNKKGLYTIRLIANNCQGSDTFTKASWFKVFDKPVTALCKNTTTFRTSNNAIGLFRFSLSDNSNETGGYFDDGEYIDFSANKVFRLKPATTYTLIGKTGPYNPEFMRLFIDYNGDGRFQNFRGEVTASTSSILGTKTLSFTTPAAPTIRNKGLRFRILSDFNSLDTNACRNLAYGQGEDYSFVFDMPVPYFSANKLNVCVGETVTFTDTSEGLADKWEWDFGSGATPRTAIGQGPHQVSYTTTGGKSVRLRMNGTDSLRKNNYISVGSGPDPIVVLKSGALVGCEGQNLILAARNKNALPFTVQWQKNGIDMPGKTDTLLNLNAINPADSGLYSAVLTNNGCKVPSMALKVVVYPKPVVSYTVNAAGQCLKTNNFVFTNTSTISQGNQSFTWYLGDGSTQSSTNASRTYTVAGPYNIKLISVSNRGCKDSTAGAVTVFPRANIRFGVNDSDQCFSGNSFVFTNNSSISSGTINYNWQFGDGSNSSLVSPTKSYSVSGVYSALLIGTSDKGCTDSARKNIRVYATPKADFQLTSATPQCLRTNLFTLTNKSTSADGSMSYRWHFGDGRTSTVQHPTIKYLTASNFTIKLITTSSFGCRDSITTAVSTKVHPRSLFTVNDSDQCLSGNVFILNNTSSISSGTIASRLWTFGDGSNSAALSPIKQYTASGNYIINLISISDWGCRDTFKKSVRVYGTPNISLGVNSADQCLKGNRFVFSNNSASGDGVLSYRWTFGDGSSTTMPAPTYSYTKPGAYVVKLVGTTNFGCADSTATNVNVWPQAISRFAVNDTDQCLRANAFNFTNQSSIASGNLSYLWHFGDGSSSILPNPVKNYSNYGIYTVTQTSLSDKGCRDTVKKPVRVYAMPVAAFNTTPQAMCQRGNNFTFTSAAGIAEGTISTFWRKGDGSVASGTNTNNRYATHGNYTVWQIVTSNFGCVDSVSKAVTVHPMPQGSFTVSPPDLCEQERAFMVNNSTIAGGTITYDWFFDNGMSKVGDTGSTQYAKHGNYTIRLIASSDKNCKDTQFRGVKVASMPVADFTAIPNPACATQSLINFSNGSTNADGTPLTADWQFGDGNRSGNTNATHTYGAAGTYTALLMVNSGKCRDTATQKITVVPAVFASFVINEPNKESRRLIALDTAQPGYSYQWSFGDTATGIGKVSQHTYRENGTYKVKLLVQNSLGCVDSSSQTLEILSPNYVDQDNWASFYIYPNPNNGKFTYKFRITQQQTVGVKLYTILGQQPVYTARWEQIEPGNYFQTIDMKKLQLSKGVYPLVIEANGQQYAVKVLYLGDE